MMPPMQQRQDTDTTTNAGAQCLWYLSSLRFISVAMVMLVGKKLASFTALLTTTPWSSWWIDSPLAALTKDLPWELNKMSELVCTQEACALSFRHHALALMLTALEKRFLIRHLRMSFASCVVQAVKRTNWGAHAFLDIECKKPSLQYPANSLFFREPLLQAWNEGHRGWSI